MLLIPLATVLLLTAGSSALACDCLDLSPSESFREADVVFEGELIGIKSTSESFPNETAYTFRVKKWLKGGQPGREVTLLQGSFDCDAYFFLDVVYRVYARRHEGQLSSGSCFANEVLSVRDRNKYQMSASQSGHEPSGLFLVEVILFFASSAIWFVLRCPPRSRS
jgi:hypothetical protein